MKYREVAVLIRDKGCEEILYIHNVDEKKLKELEMQVVENKAKKEQKHKEEMDRVSTLEKVVEELKHEIKVLKGEE